MNRLERMAVVSSLARELRAKGSWCGETHLQKAVYFLQAGSSVPLGYNFILYMHGPFSFDLRADLAAMRAQNVLRLEPQPSPYGAKLATTAVADRLMEQNRAIVRSHQSAIGEVVDLLGDKGVVDLERLATALFATLEGESDTAEKRARRIQVLKPHISEPEAIDALCQVDLFRAVFV
jgi:hypothetical protein